MIIKYYTSDQDNFFDILRTTNIKHTGFRSTEFYSLIICEGKSYFDVWHNKQHWKKGFYATLNKVKARHKKTLINYDQG